MSTHTPPTLNVNVRSILGHPFAQAIVLLILAYVFIVYGLPLIAGLATGSPAPTPASIVTLYMGMVVVVVLLYLSSNEETWRRFKQPVVRVLTERHNRPVVILRWVILILLRVLAGYLAYSNIQTTVEAPAELRAIHPAPPTTIQFRGTTLNIQGLENPLREDQANLERNVQAGAAIYSGNCVFCHGDALNGQGHLAQGLNPQPANFTDPGTIAQLQESYLFWRIAKGGPGLPTESAPWNSAMPAWEDKLSAEEIWQVILYLYSATGYSPRTWE
jgi:mono/diheme cytochrome c family protein